MYIFLPWYKQLQIITTQSGTPVAVQFSLSRTYCQVHVPKCQGKFGLAQSCCLWLD